MYKVKAGAGCLSNFWPAIELLADGMLDVYDITEIQEKNLMETPAPYRTPADTAGNFDVILEATPPPAKEGDGAPLWRQVDPKSEFTVVLAGSPSVSTVAITANRLALSGDKPDTLRADGVLVRFGAKILAVEVIVDGQVRRVSLGR